MPTWNNGFQPAPSGTRYWKPPSGVAFTASAQLEIVIGNEASELVMLLHEAHGPADQIETIDIVPPRVAVIEADQRLAREAPTGVDDLRLDIVERREVANVAPRGRQRIEPIILIAVPVLKVDEMRAASDPEVRLDAALAVAGEWLRIGEIVGRRDPDVEHAIERRDEADAPAIRTDLRRGARRIAEKQRTRNDRAGGMAISRWARPA